jgi:hypothetical protein
MTILPEDLNDMTIEMRVDEIELPLVESGFAARDANAVSGAGDLSEALLQV